MEPFKNFFNEIQIRGMAGHFAQHDATFEADQFIQIALEGFDELELKQRSEQIRTAMIACLPSDFNRAAEVLMASLGTPVEQAVTAGTVNEHGISGWAIMPMAEYVAQQGTAHFDLSMSWLEAMTSRFSAEFAIRHFL